jgi:hypothetical protein
MAQICLAAPFAIAFEPPKALNNVSAANTKGPALEDASPKVKSNVLKPESVAAAADLDFVDEQR